MLMDKTAESLVQRGNAQKHLDLCREVNLEAVKSYLEWELFTVDDDA